MVVVVVVAEASRAGACLLCYPLLTQRPSTDSVGMTSRPAPSTSPAPSHPHGESLANALGSLTEGYAGKRRTFRSPWVILGPVNPPARCLLANPGLIILACTGNEISLSASLSPPPPSPPPSTRVICSSILPPPWDSFSFPPLCPFVFGFRRYLSLFPSSSDFAPNISTPSLPTEKAYTQSTPLFKPLLI